MHIRNAQAGRKRTRHKSARGTAIVNLRRSGSSLFGSSLANSSSFKNDDRAKIPARIRRLVWCFGLRAGFAVLTLGLISTTGNSQSRTVCTAWAAKSVPPRSSTPTKSATEIPIWMTITLGEYQNVDAIRSAIDNSPCAIGLGDSVDEALGRPAFPFTKTKLELDLVVVSAADLGFPEDGGPIIDIYKRAKAIGLGLCPPDLGPALRLSYLDKPRGEFLHVAMPSVALYNHELVDFSLGNDGKRLLLVGGDGRPGLVLAGTVRFIFVRPRPDTIAHETAPLDQRRFGPTLTSEGHRNERPQ